MIARLIRILEVRALLILNLFVIEHVAPNVPVPSVFYDLLHANFDQSRNHGLLMSLNLDSLIDCSKPQIALWTYRQLFSRQRARWLTIHTMCLLLCYLPPCSVRLGHVEGMVALLGQVLWFKMANQSVFIQ